MSRSPSREEVNTIFLPSVESVASALSLTTGPGYNAEATLSTDGKKIVFTSSRDGDLDIYTMNVDGTKVRRLTNTLGYDGGPFFSPDGNWIVYRDHHPKSDEEIAHYKSLLAQGLVEPSEMDL